MTRRIFLSSAMLTTSGLYLGSKICAANVNQKVSERPNIVLIVSDDQGYADSSCYDHPKEVATPNIDRLAAEGVRLTNGYASAYVCAPTRAGLLTGRYQQRFGFYSGGDSRVGLPLSEVTIADLLKKQGYATAVIGKWHVGIEPEYQQRVFNLFDQLDPKCDGEGIGLTLVKRIVDSHGGDVWIESEGAGHGAAFCFTLPGGDNG